MPVFTDRLITVSKTSCSLARLFRFEKPRDTSLGLMLELQFEFEQAKVFASESFCHVCHKCKGVKALYANA